MKLCKIFILITRKRVLNYKHELHCVSNINLFNVSKKYRSQTTFFFFRFSFDKKRILLTENIER